MFHLAKPSIFNFTLRSRSLFLASLSSLTCLALGCSAALRSWVRWPSVASLVCLAAGCSAPLRTRRLSSLACLTSFCCDLCFWSLWRRRCSLAVALPIAQDTIHLLHSVLHVCKIVSVRSIYSKPSNKIRFSMQIG